MADNQTAPVSKKMLWAGRIVSAVVVLSLLFSATVKLGNLMDVGKELTRLGYPESHALGLGILELVCALIYAIPQTSVLGAILLTGYLGGATATHVRIDDPFIPPIITGVLVWVGLYWRDARLRALVPLRR